MTKHYSMADAPAIPSFDGELQDDLMTGSTIIDARFDGRNFLLLVERPIKLADCKGREDNTWKYATYKTSASFAGFYLATSHNRTSREMRKQFADDYDDGRFEVYLMAKAETT